ncbi:MAG: bifunctional phosphopantothenoylcysteine decarboxylase/phosphopantothenate--cysteine ligase CoaBC [Flavobacteriaceae bacterium]|nr:bifunctional phosphopantothenoylcysteine decarboxylase/phosphopantothenate--cysteine ligase CoaBC [Flavobacteriaceae bacterium]|tara:strand:- start:15951 stop:17159 length:1209 start_codon:yes stop_codon:yes gene_type:complete
MSFLIGKKVLIGVSGGIAAYKAPEIVRQLIKKGSEVRVVMTPSSMDFVTPLSLSTVSKNPVLSSFISEDLDNPLWNNHVDLANWADLFLIAPATSNTISSMANGNCNNLLLATYFSSKCPVIIAPAMDLDMYEHPTNSKNLNKLNSFGNIILPVGEGFLASGLEGKGRMLEPEEIINYVDDFFKKKMTFYGKKILITSGPTYEEIDLVRFIGNYSSGKMGFSLAKIALELGAEVYLITGPTSQKIKHPNLKQIDIISALDMFDKVKLYYKKVDIAIAAAAVSDFKPLETFNKKIKKEDDFTILKLQKTNDILDYMGKNKRNQFLIGFALESENEINNAKQKLKNKKLDFIVLNSLKEKKGGFNSDKNKITIIKKNFSIIDFKLKSKINVAKDIFNEILNEIN